MSTDLTDILMILRRLETRVTVGFESLGVDTYSNRDWISVDTPSNTIYLATLGRSINVVNKAAKALDAVVGKTYTLVCNGREYGAITIF